MREHDEPSGCVAGIWRMCANHGGAKQNHGIITSVIIPAHQEVSAVPQKTGEPPPEEPVRRRTV